MKKILTDTFLPIMLLITNFADAQTLPRLDIPVVVDESPLSNSWGGGLNSPQFSEVDLNNDGLIDLFIFDKVGDVLLTFINNDVDDAVSYTYAPSFARKFPKLYDWALLRDYDGDGVMDIFTESTVPGIFGVEVYKGYYNSGKINFEKVKNYDAPNDLLYYEQTNGSITQIYVSTVDIPSIDDIDGDGDLDILTFNIGGGYIEYFLNQSVERGFGRDSLEFELEELCWSKLYESGLSGCVDLSTNPEECATGLHSGPGNGSGRHAGSSVLTFDNDGDGDKDLILGDISWPNLVFVENGGTAQQAWGNAQDCNFPSYDMPASILSNFPAAFYLDVNNDGFRDLLTAPNLPNNVLGINNVWYYQNTSGNAMPVFKLQQRDLFGGDMIDLGTGATPAIVDVDADGLLDLVVGNETFYLSGGQKDSRLFYYRNTGTASEPAFELTDNDWLNFSQVLGSNNFYLAPEFGDLDSDGDLDLLVGESSGKLFFAENTAGQGNAFQFGAIQFGWMGIDVGQNSVPEITDLDRDGLADLVIGELNNNQIDPEDPNAPIGNLNFFKNIGTSTVPAFDPDLDAAVNNKVLGEVLSFDPGFFTGNSAPRFLDFGGEFRLFCGSTSGMLKVYTNIDGNLDGVFTKSFNDYGKLRIGHEIRPDFADLNNDGIIDMIVGNKRGGLSAFQTSYRTDGSVPVNEVANTVRFHLFPNPANGSYVQLEWVGSFEGQKKLAVRDALGRKLWQGILSSRSQQLEIGSFPAGVYFVEIADGPQRIIQKLVRSR